MAPNLLVRLLFGAALITLTVSHKDPNTGLTSCNCDGDRDVPNNNNSTGQLQPLTKCCRDKYGNRYCCPAKATTITYRCKKRDHCCNASPACIVRLSAWAIVGLLTLYHWVVRMLVFDH